MKKIKYIVMDVDGTLTDGKIYMGSGGEIMKAFNIKDGCGIHDIAIPHGMIPIIITGRHSKILENRCEELGIKSIYQGVSNKIQKLNTIIKDQSTVKRAGGVVGCPKDSTRQVLEIADYVAEHNGGEGAVRDFIDWLIK